VLNVASTATLTLNELTIANGNSSYGGGALNDGALVVTNSTFSGNTAAGPNQCERDASGFGYGGGVFDNASMIVTNSTFSGNSSAKAGGGIYYTGRTLTVTNSTFSGNSSPGIYGGGGIYSYNDGGTVTIVNSTFSGNSAGSGLGGGIYNLGPATLENTIVVNSTSGGDCANNGNPITDGGYNLDDDGSCGFSPANNSFSDNPNANLGSLGSNGGPTQTFALLYPSVAIDPIPLLANGCGSVIFTDQRGVLRPQGSACDIGAYEANQFPVAFNTSPAGLAYAVSTTNYTAAAAPFLVVGGVYPISTTATRHQFLEPSTS